QQLLRSGIANVSALGQRGVLGGDAGEGTQLKPCRNSVVGVADAALTKADKLRSDATLPVALKRTRRQFENTRRFRLAVYCHQNVLLLSVAACRLMAVPCGFRLLMSMISRNVRFQTKIDANWGPFILPNCVVVVADAARLSWR